MGRSIRESTKDIKKGAKEGINTSSIHPIVNNDLN
jgi:hypothetical protein